MKLLKPQSAIKQFKRTVREQQDRQGAMLPVLAVTIVVLFVAVVFGVDIARMHLTRSEIRTATDAAARAAVENLGRTQDTQQAINAALEVANRNVVANRGLSIDPSKIVFGSSVKDSNGRFVFTQNSEVINAARVIGERTADSPDGPVALIFGPLLGTSDFSPVASSTAVRLDRDIAMVLDKSGSMGSQGRFQALLNGVDVFVQEMNRSVAEERMSLVAYDATPTKLVDMTPNLVEIQNGIRQQSPGGLTGIGRALSMGLDSLRNDPGVRQGFSLKSVVLMTDGNQNTGVGPREIARRAARDDVIVHTITFSSGANKQLMREVADITGGIHVHADTNEQLVDAFARIANTINVLTIE